MKKEFIETISDSTGNISSRRFRKEYFKKQNKEHIWEWFEIQKQKFPEYIAIHIAICIKHGYETPPKCIVCGKTAKVQTYGGKVTFNYCSKECSHKCKHRHTKISKTKNNYTPEQKTAIENKRKQTNLEKYGVEYQTQRKDVKTIISEKLSKTQIGDIRNTLLDKQWLNEEYNVKKRSAVDIADELNVYYGTVIEYCVKHGFKIRKTSKDSLPQKKIYQYITEIYNGKVMYNDWDVLGNLELDIYIPELKIAIEHNGLPSHSCNIDNIKNKTKHLNKTKRCEELGIDLFHIRGDQWIQKTDIIKSMLENKLKLTKNKIPARKCIIKNISTKEAKEFFDKTHIQGYTTALIRYGLFYDNKLVSAMTFSKSRYNKNYDWELIRFSNILYTNVIGAFSKLLKHFRKNHSGSIISYCDYSRSNGNVYVRNGFALSGNSGVGYYWTDNHNVYHRTHFQKHKMKDKLNIFDSSLTEKENMFNNGYRIIYDCGQMIFTIQ